MKINSGSFIFDWGQTELHFLVEKGLWIASIKMLVLSDVHIGKAGHFRKNGIGVSTLVNQNNFWIMSGLLEKYTPDTVVFLGDLSHSVHNAEWDDFVDFMDSYPKLKRLLIRGNHDILDQSKYDNSSFDCRDEMKIGNLLFTHDSVKPTSKKMLNVHGHIHPAFSLSSVVTKGLKLPCYFVSDNQLALPAFGSFTGMQSVKPKVGDRVYAIADQKVIEVKVR